MQKGLPELRDLQSQKLVLQMNMKNGIIDDVDVAIFDMINRKENSLIKKYALEVHITKTGKQRSINYIENRDLWCTKLPDKTRIYAKTEIGLYKKLFEAYGLSYSGTTIKDIFEAALIEKSNTDNNSDRTISHYRFDFNRYISENFAQKDICKISKADLKAYTQQLVNTNSLTKKAFLSYKGVLNLIFNYALEYDLIQTNPVKAIKNSAYLKSCDTKKPSSAEKILSEEEIERIKQEIYRRMKYPKYNGYYINGYAILFAIETGVRLSELPALKWTDIHEDYIHIHAQQLYHVRPGGKEYYYSGATKNEKGVSEDGRQFPLTDNIKSILEPLRASQKRLKIKSEYIFCHEDGEWIKTDAYMTCLRRMMRRLKMPVTKNHAFRMSLNSNIFIKKLDLPVTVRAKLLGHSVETNLRHYSFAPKDDIKDLKALLNGQVAPR